MPFKYYEFRGKMYRREELYAMFHISQHEAYKIMKNEGVDLVTAVQMEGYLSYDAGGENIVKAQSIPIITETIERNIKPYKQVCSKFGCAKELSLREKLFGNRCIDHQW